MFVWLPTDLDKALKAAGANYYRWTSEAVAPERRGRHGEIIARLIASFATGEADVAAFLAAIDAAWPKKKRAPRSPGTPLF